MLPTIPTTIDRTVEAPRSPLFDWFVQVELPRILLGYGPIPAIVATTGQTGYWWQPGSSRTVRQADGNTAREEVTACEAPSFFAYRVKDFTSPLIGPLVDHATGEWWFTDAPAMANGRPVTRLVWRYTFILRSEEAAFEPRPILELWSGFMRVALDAIKTLGEREAVSPGTPKPTPAQ